jgi:hypothetical protein
MEKLNILWNIFISPPETAAARQKNDRNYSVGQWLCRHPS